MKLVAKFSEGELKAQEKVSPKLNKQMQLFAILMQTH